MTIKTLNLLRSATPMKYGLDDQIEFIEDGDDSKIQFKMPNTEQDLKLFLDITRSALAIAVADRKKWDSTLILELMRDFNSNLDEILEETDPMTDLRIW